MRGSWFTCPPSFFDRRAIKAIEGLTNTVVQVYQDLVMRAEKMERKKTIFRMPLDKLMGMENVMKTLP